MIVETITDSQTQELTITIKGAEKDAVTAMARHVKNYQHTETTMYSVRKRDGITVIDKREIMWLSVAHNTTTLYLMNNEAITVTKPLTQVLEELQLADLLRVSQSSAIRVRALKEITAGFSGALTAVLKNGEHVAISRQFVKRVYEYLQLK